MSPGARQPCRDRRLPWGAEHGRDCSTCRPLNQGVQSPPSPTATTVLASERPEAETRGFTCPYLNRRAVEFFDPSARLLCPGLLVAIKSHEVTRGGGTAIRIVRCLRYALLQRLDRFAPQELKCDHQPMRVPRAQPLNEYVDPPPSVVLSLHATASGQHPLPYRPLQLRANSTYALDAQDLFPG